MIFIRRLIASALILGVIGSLFVIFLQEFIIFPMLWCKFLPPSVNSRCISHSKPPTGVESFFVTSLDQKSVLQVFRSKAEHPTGYVAIIFHGNGETIYQMNYIPFFNKNGITAYSVDYRGYVNSSGWPSEDGIYNDADTLVDFVLSNEKITPAGLVVLGASIGTGPAAYVASKIHPKVLMLLSPYENIPSVVKGHAIYKYFLPFLRYSFPVDSYIKELDNRTCMVLAHGDLDKVIPVEHSLRLIPQIPPTVKIKTLISPNARHADIFYKVENGLNSGLRDCLGFPE